MTGTAQTQEAPESELSDSFGALESAVRSLRDEAGRVTAVLDGVASALDRERLVDDEGLVDGEPAASDEPAAEEPTPSGPAASFRPLAMRSTAGERSPDLPADEGPGQPESWVSGLLCALALLASVALLKVGLAVAIPVVIVAAVLLRMSWWMPALAAFALGLALAIESPGGSMADRVAAMLVVFLLVAGALVLYQVWQRLHLRLQS